MTSKLTLTALAVALAALLSSAAQAQGPYVGYQSPANGYGGYHSPANGNMPSTRAPSVTYSTYGNQTYGSDGSTITQYGNQTYITPSKGPSVTCSTYGNQTYCN